MLKRDEAVRGRRSLSVASVFRVIIVVLPWPKYVPLTHAMGTHFLPIYFCRNIGTILVTSKLNFGNNLVIKSVHIIGTTWSVHYTISPVSQSSTIPVILTLAIVLDSSLVPGATTRT